MSLDDERRRIDAIDDALLGLLDERAKVARAIGQQKARAGIDAHDPARELALLARLEAQVAARAEPNFPTHAVRPVFREIISACLSQQLELEVAFLGPPGTFTHMAAQSAFGLAPRYQELATIGAVFDAVERGHARYGVVPIENSTEGGVTFTLDELVGRAVRIWGEVVVDVAHCLLRERGDLTGIERVYSHPQALAQCRAWLGKNLPAAELVPAASTAAAARQARGDPAGAAIASRLSAELEGLGVVRAPVQDRTQNATRFAILALEEHPPTGDDKTSIVYSLKHERGALRATLALLEARGLNLTRIESRPHPERLWEYLFFTDFEGHSSDPEVGAAIAALAELSPSVKVLGSYPRARPAG